MWPAINGFQTICSESCSNQLETNAGRPVVVEELDANMKRGEAMSALLSATLALSMAEAANEPAADGTVAAILTANQ
ncbi:MAG TPA: hypothetical protein VGN03_02440, partial [Steroidobacteraceae bacterium]